MKIKEFYKQIGFENNNNCYYLEKEGYNIYLKEFESFIKINSYYVTLNEEIKKEHLDEFTKAAFDNVCYMTSTESKNDTLIITLPTSFKINEGFINSCINVLNSIILKLQELHYTPKTRCKHCHKEAELGFFNDEYIPLHRECKEDIIKELILKKEDQDKKKYRYVINFLYSIIFSCLGFIPSLLLTYYFNIIITPLLLLITTGSFIGLHFSKVKNDKWSYLITLIISSNFIILFNIFAFNHLSNINQQDFITYFNENSWYVIRKVLFSILFIFGVMRIYKMFFSKYHINFDKIIKNI